MRNAKQVNEDITDLIRARNTLIWVVTREELRAERALVAIAASVKYRTYFWDCADGLTDEKGTRVQRGGTDPKAMLDAIESDLNREERAVYVMRDLHAWTDPSVVRTLRTLARKCASSKPGFAKTVVVLSSVDKIPPELASAAVVDYPLPDRDEMGTILDDSVARAAITLPALADTAVADAGVRDAAIDAVVGLTADEAASCYARSLVRLKTIDPTTIATEKRRAVTREGVLSWIDPDPRGLDAIGGLDVLKAWAIERRASFSPEARAYGLPAPRGVFMCGIQGTGKSLFPKALAAAWGQPLLKLDLGALRSKFVGDSEANIRKATKLAETIAPCLLWLDELDKALAGATGPQGDGGVASDSLGWLLTWAQERIAPVCVVATATRVDQLPPELLRKGRFDDLFFLDLPTGIERRAILDVTLRQYKREGADIDRALIAGATAGFTGSEIAALVPDAMRIAFADGARPIRTDDLLRVVSAVVPLSKTSAEKIQALRDWAKEGRARYASTPDALTVGNDGAGAYDIN